REKSTPATRSWAGREGSTEAFLDPSLVVILVFRSIQKIRSARADQRSHQKSCHTGPGGCIQLAFIALRRISRLPGAGRDPYRSRRGDSRGAQSQKTFKLSDLWKHGSRLSPGQRERLISKS